MEAVSHPPMVTANVVHRTFPIKWHYSRGTAFEIDHKGEQYLITARHVVEGIRTGDRIQILHEETWKSLQIVLVGQGAGVVDVAVLKGTTRLSPPLALPTSSKDIVLGQQVFFLGYPFGWDGGLQNINRGFPVPIVKSGIVSSMPSTEGFFVDAHVNKGFSGGPLLFVPPGDQATNIRVAGIVVGHPKPPILRPIVDQYGNEKRDLDGRPIGIRENPGFVFVIDISEAIALIESQPEDVITS